MRGLTKIAKTVDALYDVVFSIASFAVIGGLCWHGYVYYKAWNWQKIEITGAFKEKPLPGYVWQDDETNGVHLFWQNTNAVWQAGIPNPSHANVISADAEGTWQPKAGYQFLDASRGLWVKWQPGIRFGDYKVVSADREGYWNALPGYVLTDPGNSFATEWRAGLSDPVSHPNMVSGQEEGSWIPIVKALPPDSLVKTIDDNPFSKLFNDPSSIDTAKKR